MTTRRSIFKCIPAMIAAAVLPKAWTARASELNVGHVTLHEGMIKGEWTQYAHPFPMVGETGPEIIMPISGTIKRMTWSMDGPIRIYVDDQYGGTTELSRAISAEFTVK